MSRRIRQTLLAALLALAQSGATAAQTCAPESFGAAVDAAGVELRKFNAEAQPKLKDKLKALRDKKGWRESNYEEKGLDYLRDERIAALDVKSNELYTKIDTLGRPDPGAPVDCAGLAELEAAGAEMLAVFKTKSIYLSDKIDREIGVSPPGEAKAPSPPVAAAKDLAAPGAGAPTARPGKIPEASSPADRPSSWDTTTAEAPASVEALAPGEPYVLPPAAPEDDGYTIEEIQEATRGFFGTISTSLAGVIEHAFHKSGRPTAYVLGTEGGGALLAGFRYGKGTLYLRSGGKEKVYWHGPSLGYDVGAEGSRTLFLIYRLSDAQHLFRSFTAIDGTAYLVGGVGLTFLKGGDVIMAPIRSGLGLRIGASIGYIRFTARPTWNPF
jgi:hypothetical protein